MHLHTAAGRGGREVGGGSTTRHGIAHLHGKQICRAHSVEVRTCHCKFKCSQSTSWPGQGARKRGMSADAGALGLMIVMGTKANTSWKMHVPSYVLWLVEFRCSASALSGKLQAAKAPVKLIKNVGSDRGLQLQLQRQLQCDCDQSWGLFSDSCAGDNVSSSSRGKGAGRRGGAAGQAER